MMTDLINIPLVTGKAGYLQEILRERKYCERVLATCERKSRDEDSKAYVLGFTAFQNLMRDLIVYDEAAVEDKKPIKNAVLQDSEGLSAMSYADVLRSVRAYRQNMQQILCAWKFAQFATDMQVHPIYGLFSSHPDELLFALRTAINKQSYTRHLVIAYVKGCFLDGSHSDHYSSSTRYIENVKKKRHNQSAAIQRKCDYVSYMQRRRRYR